jgi:putative FmdB family regulatory protein
MPTYGYKCKECDNTFEVVQSMSDEPLTECPKCSGPVSKIFYPVGIAFKGSGFHINDYKSTKRNGVEKETAATDNNKTETKTTPGKPECCSSCSSAKTCSS